MKKLSFPATFAITLTLNFVSATYAAPAANFQQAVADYNGGRYAQANKELESCKQAYPTNAMVHYYLALCKQALGQIETAKSEFQWVQQNGDARLKSLAQTGFAQLSKARSTSGVSSVAAAPAQAAPSTQVKTTLATSSSGGKVQKILEFWAEWCQPCKAFAPTFEAVTAKLRGIKVERVNLDENQELAGKYSVQSIPRMVMLDGSNNVLYNDSPPRDEESLTELINKYR